MKKAISFSLIILVVLTLCSCSDDASIVGAWLAKDGGTVIGADMDNLTSYDVYYIFYEDGTGQMLNIFPDEHNEKNMATDFSYTVDKNNTITLNIGTNQSEGTYNIDGDILTMETQRTGSFSMSRVDIEAVPSLVDVPFNLICGTDTIKEYSGKIGERVIVEVDYIPTGMTVEWQTNNPEVAAIEPSRLGTQCIIFIEGVGNATVTATRGDKIRTIEVIGGEKADSNSPITSAQIKYAGSPLIEFTEAIGHNIELTLHYEPANAFVTDEDVRWYSEDSTIAAVQGDTKGCTITCKGVGVTTITCEMFGEDACSVTVYVRESW